MAARGAIPTVGGRDFYFYQPLGKSYSLTSYVPDPVDGPLIYCQSRALLEFCIRERIEEISNVRIDDQTTVRQPIWRSDRVVGLVVDRRGASERGSEAVDADLVVDAAGRASRPLYGQGMSAAARQTLVLTDLLARRVGSGRGLSGAALEFFPLAFEETRAPWLLACLADFLSPQCKGDFPSEEREAMKMLGYLNRAAKRDPAALEILQQVGGMHAPLSALLTPEWIAKKTAARKARQSI